MTSRSPQKLAVVTGGASGIGAAVTVKLKSCGYDVIVFDLAATGLSPTNAFDQVPPGSGQIQIDIRRWDDVAAVVHEIERDRSIDLLVNAAGLMQPGAVAELHLDSWARHLDVNLTGTMHMCRAVSSGMARRSSGAIVNIASRLALVGQANFAAYSASKFGVIGFSQSLALEMAPLGVRVNSVCPGQIDNTGMRAIAEKLSRSVPDHRSGMQQRIPMGRFGLPEEVAELVEFLASERSSYITGQSISICGGRSIS